MLNSSSLLFSQLFIGLACISFCLLLLECMQAASMALHEYPILNSSVDEKCENITYKVFETALEFLVLHVMWWHQVYIYDVLNLLDSLNIIVYISLHSSRLSYPTKHSEVGTVYLFCT